MKGVVIAVIVLLLLLMLGGAVYAMRELSHKPSSGTLSGTSSGTPQPPKEVFFSRWPGGGYVDGKTFVESQAYCQNHGGRLATKDELLAARSLGFESCSFGWLADKSLAFVMQQGKTGCVVNADGITASAPQTNLELRRGTYCVGTAPPAGTKTYDIKSEKMYGLSRGPATNAYARGDPQGIDINSLEYFSSDSLIHSGMNMEDLERFVNY